MSCFRLEFLELWPAIYFNHITLISIIKKFTCCRAHINNLQTVRHHNMTGLRDLAEGWMWSRVELVSVKRGLSTMQVVHSCKFGLTNWETRVSQHNSILVWVCELCASLCVWRWDLSGPWRSGVLTGCWCGGNAGGCWWPLWSPAALVSRWSFWTPVGHWPETPQSGQHTFMSQRSILITQNVAHDIISYLSILQRDNARIFCGADLVIIM